MSHTIAVYNFKGGVGKTTTTLNLALSWSKSFKVLVIDLDPQCNLTGSISSGYHKETVYTQLRNLLHGRTSGEDPIAITPYLHLLPGDLEMASMESNNQFISFGSSFMDKLLQRYQSEYDFILIDCPTNFGVLVKSILQSSKNILIPAIPDNFSITGIKTLMTYILASKNEHLNVLGVFFNLYNSRLKLMREKLEKARETFGNLILESTISRSIKVGEATDIGQSIGEYSPDNTAAVEFHQLSDELLEKFHQRTVDRRFIIPELLQRVSA